MLDSQKWWGAFDMGHIYFTTDGGINWTEQQTGQGGFLVGTGIQNPCIPVPTKHKNNPME